MSKRAEHPLAYKFRIIYANIPLFLRRQEILAIVDDEPMTAYAIKIEVENNTEAGHKALNFLDRVLQWFEEGKK